MANFENLKKLTLKEILTLDKSYKMKTISLLIDQIAEDEVYLAKAHFETEQEQKAYFEYIKK